MAKVIATDGKKKKVNFKASALKKAASTSKVRVKGRSEKNKNEVPLSQLKEKVEVKKAASKNKTAKLAFEVNDFVVYPTHGVGRIVSVEKQEISGMHLELFVVEFDKDKMVLRVPIAKAEGSGMRKLSSPQKMTTALSALKGRARVKRTMWSRRAQEYEAKINSGDPVSIAEVVRDLYRSTNQPEQSYSERQIYEAALERLARELAAVEKIEEEEAAGRLEGMLGAA